MINKIIYLLALLIPIMLILTLKSEKVEDISTDRNSNETFQNIDTIISLIEEKNLIINESPKLVEIEKIVFLEVHDTIVQEVFIEIESSPLLRQLSMIETNNDSLLKTKIVLQEKEIDSLERELRLAHLRLVVLAAISKYRIF